MLLPNVVVQLQKVGPTVRFIAKFADKGAAKGRPST